MPTTDPRARLLAEAVHGLAREKATTLPAWPDLPLSQREKATAEARLWLRAAVDAGLVPAVAPSPPATDRATLRDRVAEAIASCPGRELSPNQCRCPCYGCKHHCAAHDPSSVVDMPAAWIDGHPQLEAIASAVYERCECGDGGIVHDDPRNIAVAALKGLLAPGDRDGADQTERRDMYAEMTAADRAEANRLTLSEALGLGTGAPWAAVRERAAELRRMADEAQQPEPELSGDLIEDYLRFLRGQGPEPDLSQLSAGQREAVAGQFEIVKALADRGPELPPLDRDPVARRLGLVDVPAVGARQPDTETPTRAAIRQKLRRWAYAAGHIESELDGAADRMYTLIAQDIARVPDRCSGCRYVPCADCQPSVGGVADETGEGGDRLVAHVLATGTDLHCLRCAPPPYGDIWTPVIADELEDGGVCVRCGVDVLIPQEPSRG